MRSVIHKPARIAVALIAFAAFGLSQTAFAVGTASSTPVDNRATVNYDVSGVPQTLIESSPSGNSTPGVGFGADTSFVVDNRVDLVVATTDVVSVIVSPGETGALVTFTVRNDGNTTQDFNLAAADLLTGTLVFDTDTIDSTALQPFVDVNSNNVYDAGTDTTFIDELAADATETVLVAATVPLTAVNLDVINVSLRAITHDAGGAGVLGALTAETAGPDTPGLPVDVVFGDAAGTDDTTGARDGEHSDRSGYRVQSATLTITKTSAVISDPFNGTTNPKAIPGAVIEYTVRMTNTGIVDATSVSVLDNIDSDVVLEAVVPDYTAGNVRIIDDVLGTPTTTNCDADADATDGCTIVGAVLTIDPTAGITVSAGQTNDVQFRVSIQ